MSLGAALSSALRLLLMGALVGAALTGCTLASLPSQEHPTCSWSSSPPANADSLCTTAFDTLKKVVHAVQVGDKATIRTLVTNPTVLSRILSYSQKERARHARSLHVVPSFTLEITGDLLGAGFYVLGKDHAGNVNSPETLYLKVHRNAAKIVEDQPNQDW